MSKPLSLLQCTTYEILMAVSQSTMFSKKLVFLVLFLFQSVFLFSQVEEWTWMNGSDRIPAFPFFGTQGVSSPQNIPGGRSSAMSWKDGSGNFWLFSGFANTADGEGTANDLWKYDSTTKEWTWVKGGKSGYAPAVYGTQGVASPANTPGGRMNSTTWTDQSGNLWLFGGSGFNDVEHGTLSDLWKYNPSTNQWTWVKGDKGINKVGVYGTLGTPAAANVPGARTGSVAWVDATGNVWLFGGYGFASNTTNEALNDLWKYNPATNQWTWMKGDKFVAQPGVYGTKGTAENANKPGGRSGTMSWIDNGGSLWLFGGKGYSSNGSYGELSDLWKYNTSANQWTWVSGDNTNYQPGIYGTQGNSSASNKPGARYSSVSWKDSNGDFYLFGGEGYAHLVGRLGSLNDIWKYSLTTNQWTWLKGDSTVNFFGIPGVYSSPGVSAAENKPGGRSASVAWLDDAGSLWLFGGSGLASNNQSSRYLADLMKYDLATNNWIWIKGDNVVYERGRNGTKGVSDASNYPGARQSAVSWKDKEGNLWMFGGYGWGGSGIVADPLNDLWRYEPANGQWTWMKGDTVQRKIGVYGTKGIASVDNTPGARYLSVSWVDSAGMLWLFGGYGYATDPSTWGYLNDMWKYDPNTNQWTWMHGDNSNNQYGVFGTQGVGAANNKVGARYNPSAWTDKQGNLYLFGGFGYATFGAASYLSDLWKYNVATNQWTWVKGDNIQNQSSVYGAPGATSPSYKPGARRSASVSVDTAGNAWMFGGRGVGYSNHTNFNEVWKYNPNLNQWTWVKGDINTNASGVYGTRGVASPNNKRGSRYNSFSWSDNKGSIYLYAGSGMSAVPNGTVLIGPPNDVWKFNVSTTEWTWIKGDSLPVNFPVYGTKGQSNALNNPGGRYDYVAWTDSLGNMSMFGGFGLSTRENSSTLNDMWKFTLVIPAPKITSFSPQRTSAGSTVTIIGANFTGATSVTFGDMPAASFIVDNRNTISAVVSTGSSGTVTVTTPGGTDSLAGFSICLANTWTGAIDTSWNNPGNWDCHVVPLPGADVTIPDVANQPKVEGGIVVGDLNITDELKLTSDTFTINGSITGPGTITGSSTANLVINGNAGVIRFTAGAAILKAITINPAAAAVVDGNLVITGP
jgi:N-acetylneuraminic acid mutarotase